MKHATHPVWHHNSTDNEGLILGLVSHQKWEQSKIWGGLEFIWSWDKLVTCGICLTWHHVNSDLMAPQLSSAQKSHHLLDSTSRLCSCLVWGFLTLPKLDLQETDCQQSVCRLSFLSGGARGRINIQKALEKQRNSPRGAERTQRQPKIQETWSSWAH